MSNPDPPPKSWWSLSKASSTRELHRNFTDGKVYTRRSSLVSKPSAGFKSIAEAIGFKSKKPAQDSISQQAKGYSLVPVASARPLVLPLFPPEPQTPVDTRGKSLPTLPDDPLAGRPSTIQVRQSPVPSRLSAYSNSSATDLLSRKTDSIICRTSYTSSSTNSHSYGFDSSSPVFSSSPKGLPESKKVRLKRSVGSMQVTMPDHSSRQAALTPSGTNPNLTGKDPNPDRPKLRSRGLTDGGLSQKAGFFVKEPILLRQLSATSTIFSATTSTPESILKPRIGRQASARLHAPPTAPPTTSLPATPPSTDKPDPRQRKGLSVSSTLVGNDNPSTLSPIHDAKPTSQHDLRLGDSIPESVEPPRDSKTVPSSPRILKKASSQRSLTRGTSPSSVRTTIGSEQSPDKRTQRNFHSQLPLPVIPLPIRTSFSPPSQPSAKDPTSPSSIIEPKKHRKRLFSNGSQRPSTSTYFQTNHKEEDSLSIFSLRSEHDTSHAYKPWAVTRNYSHTPSSFWDEGPDTTPSSPTVHYPQAIMSRDQLAKLEASVSGLADSSPTDTHESSFPPIGSAESEKPQEQPDSVALSPTLSFRPGRRSVRASSATLQSLQSRSGSPRRPVTADPLMRESKEPEDSDTAEPPLSPDINAGSTTPPLDSETGLTSLPPPPRPRLRSANSIHTTRTMATVSGAMERLDFPKVKLQERPNTAITTISPLQPNAPGTGNLRPPLLCLSKSAGATRNKGRPSAVLEKSIHRRSLMRKPSFLEIDGDAEAETQVREKRDSLFLAMKAAAASVNSNNTLTGTKNGESFLDFARESFDTVRT